MNQATLSLRRAPSAALGDYFEHAQERRLVPDSMLSPRDSPMRQLSSGELATIRVASPLASQIVTNRYGTAIEAAIRIAIWEERGLHLSGRAMADALQWFFSPRSHGAGQPWRGWELLRAVDLTSQHHGVAVYLDAELPSNDPNSRRRIRLHDRLTESGRARPN